MRARILASHPLHSSRWEIGLDIRIPRSFLRPKYFVPQSQALGLMGLAHSDPPSMRTNPYKEAFQRLSHVDQSETHILIKLLKPQEQGFFNPMTCWET